MATPAKIDGSRMKREIKQIKFCVQNAQLCLNRIMASGSASVTDERQVARALSSLLSIFTSIDSIEDITSALGKVINLEEAASGEA